eukprot:gene47728-64730_t
MRRFAAAPQPRQDDGRAFHGRVLERPALRQSGLRHPQSRGQCRPHTTGLPMKNECPPSAAQARTVFGFAKLPAAYATLVMPLLLSILMTFVVSAVSTLRSIGHAL